jgi:hypothetical protein
VRDIVIDVVYEMCHERLGHVVSSIGGDHASHPLGAGTHITFAVRDVADMPYVATVVGLSFEHLGLPVAVRCYTDQLGQPQVSATPVRPYFTRTHIETALA